MENSIKVKPGVVFMEINKYTLEFLLALDFCCKKYGQSYTITSANDSEHSATTYHDDNVAWDIRLKDLKKSHWYVLRDTLKSSLGNYFDVIVENENDATKCHIHAECDLEKLADYFMDHAEGGR
jgi:hypothetical protein